jgi:hypothetical protein
MPKQLLNFSIAAPGQFGLNKQTSGGILPPGWATIIDNIVYDDKGRLSARKGTQHVNSTTSTNPIKAIHEYVDAGGNLLTIVAAGNDIYKNVSGTLTSIDGSITTPTADNWKFQNFNGTCVGYQAGHAPIVLTTVGGTFTNAGGTQYNGDDVLAAYGRLWTVFDNTLYYSDLLINSYAGGSSGSFDLATYWKGGMDEAVAIADFNGYLVVFGKRNIIIYDNPDDPTTTMSIVENISGIGCVARDSVQNIGEDVIFLSADGVRSLSRLIQEKSMPIGDISKNNKEYLVDIVVSETPANIKSVYSKTKGFYLLSLPTEGISLYFDLKRKLEDGSARTTTWGIAPTAAMSTVDDTLYLATVSGFLSTYTGYLDGKLSDGSGGSTYDIDFEGAWNDGGQEASALIKIPKKINYNVLGGKGRTLNIKWAFDYDSSFYSANITIPAASGAEFNIAEYNIDEFSGGLDFNNVKAAMTGTGQVIKVGFSATVNNEVISIQRLDMHVKTGRMN